MRHIANLLRLSLLLGIAMPASFAAQAGVRYRVPASGSEFNLPQSSISLRLSSRVDPTSVARVTLSAVGSESGLHSGRLELSDDAVTLVFTPDAPFRAGEQVRVSLGAGLRASAGGRFAPDFYLFTIARESVPMTAELRRALADDDSPTPESIGAGASRMSAVPPSTLVLHDTLPATFPPITVTALNNPAPGRLLLITMSTTKNSYQPYMTIIDRSGTPLYYNQIGQGGYDFDIQKTGLLTYFSFDKQYFLGLDSSFNVIDSFACGNGYPTDFHELQVLPNGHALLMSYDAERYDMRQVVETGDSNALVVGLIIQEIDKQKRVVFQWRSWDHIRIDDALFVNLDAPTVDYIHGNSIELDTDGNLIISSRHTSDLMKINRTTGAIMWRLGGKNNQFTFLNDTVGFSYQHDARRQANGHISLFDNGNHHTPPFSRAIEYEVDENAKTVKLVWQYRHSPENYGVATGSVQYLPNGNKLVDWGIVQGVAHPIVMTEVHPDGSTAHEIQLPQGMFSYRIHRYPWAGTAESFVEPRPITPPIGARMVIPMPTLTWTTSWGATQYHLQFSATGSFDSGMVAIDTLLTTLSLPFLDSLMPSHTYIWRIRGERPGDSTIWSDSATFTIAPLLARAITIGSPSDSASLRYDHTIMKWKAPAETWDYFRFEVSTDTGFHTLFMLDSMRADTEWSSTRLRDGYRYYWRIRGHNEAGWGDPGTVHTFIVNLVTTSLASPAPATDLKGDSTVTLIWHRLRPDATRYTLQIAFDSNFTSSALFDTARVDTTFRFGSLNHQVTYYWRVRPGNALGWGAFSAPYSFVSVKPQQTVDGSPSMPAADALLPNAPNPFRGVTTIPFVLADEGPAKLEVRDMLGRVVATLFNGKAAAGTSVVMFDAASLPAGSYLCRLTSASGSKDRMIQVQR